MDEIQVYNPQRFKDMRYVVQYKFSKLKLDRFRKSPISAQLNLYFFPSLFLPKSIQIAYGPLTKSVAND